MTAHRSLWRSVRILLATVLSAGPLVARGQGPGSRPATQPAAARSPSPQQLERAIDTAAIAPGQKQELRDILRRRRDEVRLASPAALDRMTEQILRDIRQALSAYSLNLYMDAVEAEGTEDQPALSPQPAGPESLFATPKPVGRIGEAAPEPRRWVRPGPWGERAWYQGYHPEPTLHRDMSSRAGEFEWYQGPRWFARDVFFRDYHAAPGRYTGEDLYDRDLRGRGNWGERKAGAVAPPRPQGTPAVGAWGERRWPGAPPPGGAVLQPNWQPPAPPQPPQRIFPPDPERAWW